MHKEMDLVDTVKTSYSDHPRHYAIAAMRRVMVRRVYHSGTIPQNRVKHATAC
jgi:hypothetical protein